MLEARLTAQQTRGRRPRRWPPRCRRRSPRRRSASRRRTRRRAPSPPCAVFTPSATMFISATISSIFRPWPSCSPTCRLRLWLDMHVAMRSPMPASPAKVTAWPPIASPILRQLDQPPGDHRGLRVVAGPEPVGHARGDRDHVLQRAPHLASDDVGVRVHPEEVDLEDALQVAGDHRVVRRHHRRGSVTGEHLLRQVRAGEHREGMAGQHLVGHLAHAQAGCPAPGPW